jgi:tropomyosin
VQALEATRDQWEGKYEDMSKKHAELQKDLHDLEVSISNV